VTENNPGNAPAWAGPPEDGDRGPPEYAGQDDNETAENGTDDNTNETDDSDDSNASDDDSGSPPEQARGNGNGN